MSLQKALERIQQAGGVQSPDGWVIPGNLDLSHLGLTKKVLTISFNLLSSRDSAGEENENFVGVEVHGSRTASKCHLTSSCACPG